MVRYVYFALEAFFLASVFTSFLPTYLYRQSVSRVSRAKELSMNHIQIIAHSTLPYGDNVHAYELYILRWCMYIHTCQLPIMVLILMELNT